MVDIPIRSIFLNGSFDLPHAGHFNVLRQAKTMFPEARIVVGIHASCALKGSSVCSLDEKERILKACEFVDEVVTNIPYAEITPSLLDHLECDAACHGHDEVIFPDGKGMYDDAKAAGRFVELRRSEGVSTTILIHRILNPGLLLPSFPITSARIQSFRFKKKQELAGRGVFIAGRFDLLHWTHVAVLEEARELGDFLLVGITSSGGQTSASDKDEWETRETWETGNKAPTGEVQSLGERSLSLLSMRVVDEIMWEYEFTPELCDVFGIKIAVSVSHPDFEQLPAIDGVDYIELEPPSVSRDDIVNRIIRARLQFEERNERRSSGQTLI